MRCYITLLACGWLLLSPPERWGAESLLWFRSTHIAKWLGYGEDSPMPSLEKPYNLHAPYSKWDVRRSFGSADDCTAELSRIQEVGLNNFLNLRERQITAIEAKNSEAQKVLERSRERALVQNSLYQRFVCIPSDAVKLE